MSRSPPALKAKPAGGELRFLRGLVRDLLKQNAEYQRMLARRENLEAPPPPSDELPPPMPLDERALPAPLPSFTEFDVLREGPASVTN